MEVAGPSETWALTYQLHAVTSQKTVIVIHTTTRIWELMPVVADRTLLCTEKVKSQNVSSEFTIFSAYYGQDYFHIILKSSFNIILLFRQRKMGVSWKEIVVCPVVLCLFNEMDV